jgi:hypothetical protein
MAAWYEPGKPSPMLDPAWNPWAGYSHAARIAAILKAADAAKKAPRV